MGVEHAVFGAEDDQLAGLLGGDQKRDPEMFEQVGK
jgi:hypothetical protein